MLINAHIHLYDGGARFLTHYLIAINVLEIDDLFVIDSNSAIWSVEHQENCVEWVFGKAFVYHFKCIGYTFVRRAAFFLILRQFDK